MNPILEAAKAIVIAGALARQRRSRKTRAERPTTRAEVAATKTQKHYERLARRAEKRIHNVCCKVRASDISGYYRTDNEIIFEDSDVVRIRHVLCFADEGGEADFLCDNKKYGDDLYYCVGYGLHMTADEAVESLNKPEWSGNSCADDIPCPDCLRRIGLSKSV